MKNIERTKDYINNKIKIFKNRRTNLNEGCYDYVIEESHFQKYSNDCENIINSLNKKEYDHVGGGY